MGIYEDCAWIISSWSLVQLISGALPSGVRSKVVRFVLFCFSQPRSDSLCSDDSDVQEMKEICDSAMFIPSMERVWTKAELLPEMLDWLIMHLMPELFQLTRRLRTERKLRQHERATENCCLFQRDRHGRLKRRERGKRRTGTDWTKKSETELTASVLKKTQNTQETKRTLFNWLKQDKPCKFSRKSSFSSYVQKKTIKKNQNKQTNKNKKTNRKTNN